MRSGKEVAKFLIPPIMVEIVRLVREGMVGVKSGRNEPFTGPFTNWVAARASSSGWDSDGITKKTLEVSLKVRNGEIAFQQDTIEYDRIIYSEPILAFLAICACHGKGEFDVVDFGGSLGTNFFQNRKLLDEAIVRGNCSWRIVERPQIANLGRQHFQTDYLRFFESVGEARAEFGKLPKSVLFSGSLQCLERPCENLG